MGNRQLPPWQAEREKRDKQRCTDCGEYCQDRVQYGPEGADWAAKLCPKCERAMLEWVAAGAGGPPPWSETAKRAAAPSDE